MTNILLHILLLYYYSINHDFVLVCICQQYLAATVVPGAVLRAGLLYIVKKKNKKSKLSTHACNVNVVLQSSALQSSPSSEIQTKPSPYAPAASQSRRPSCREVVGGPTPLPTPPGLRIDTAPSWGMAMRSPSPPRCVRSSPSASSPFVWLLHPEKQVPGEAGGSWRLFWPPRSSSVPAAFPLFPLHV